MELYVFDLDYGEVKGVVAGVRRVAGLDVVYVCGLVEYVSCFGVWCFVFILEY